MLKIVNVKDRFAEAIFKLSKNRDIENITVSDIVNEANSSRRTFYNHFLDKYDLIHWIYRREIEEIHRSVDRDLTEMNYDAFSDHLISMYQIFLDHKDFFYKALKETGQNSFRLYFIEHSIEYTRQSIIARFGEEAYTDAIDYSVRYNNYGQVSMCIEWILTGMKKTPEQMARLHRDNIPIPIRPFFAQ